MIYRYPDGSAVMPMTKGDTSRSFLLGDSSAKKFDVNSQKVDLKKTVRKRKDRKKTKIEPGLMNTGEGDLDVSRDKVAPTFKKKKIAKGLKQNGEDEKHLTPLG